MLSYASHEKWVEKLFTMIMRPAMPHYHVISVEQIIAADKELFCEVGRATRGGFRIDITGGTFVLDTHWKDKMECSMVSHLLMPVPMPSRSAQPANDNTGKRERPRREKVKVWKEPKKENEKGKGKGKGKDRFMPPGLIGNTRTTAKGDPICFNYNLPNGCPLPVSNGRCSKGLHVCCKPGCGQAHSFQSHAATA
jgi:hypothetical protein